ncbi:MAG: dihydrofolate reductase [Pseudomonadota bacterium]
MRITLIAALDEDNAIGRAGQLPWRLPADLKHFKRSTLGKPVILGRRTYASIGKPLPDRTTIVLTRQADWMAEGCTVVHDVDQALAVARATGAEEVMVAGGAELYRQFLPRAERILLTIVHAHVGGDVRFPDFDSAAWTEIERREREPDDRNAHALSFVTLERRDARA